MPETRIVPLPLKLKILLGSEMQAVFIIIAVVFFHALTFQVCSDITRSLVLQYYQTRSVSGRLLPDVNRNVAFADQEDNVRYNVYRHCFEYVINGRTLYGVGYSRSRVEVSQDVTVQYSPKFPACSQIPGMPPIWDRNIVWIPGVGIAMILLIVACVLPRRIRIIRTLLSGQLTTARISKRSEYYHKAQKRVSYEFRFKADDGLYYTTKLIENAPYNEALEDEANEPLIYDPARPRVAFVLDGIPGRPRIDETGLVRDSKPWTTPCLFITLVLALATISLCIKSVVNLLV